MFRFLGTRSVLRYGLLAVVLVGLGTGCGLSRKNAWNYITGANREVSAEVALLTALDVSDAYRKMGRMVSEGDIPFVGNLEFLKGPADSVVGIFQLSFESRALVFQRDHEGGGFVARYGVKILIGKNGDAPIQVVREELVRVSEFSETMHNVENIQFTQNFHLIPGSYDVSVEVANLAVAEKLGIARGTYDVPEFTAGSTSSPILVHRVARRGSSQDPVSILLNTRGSVAFGGDTLLVYIEGYGFTEETAVPFEVRDEFGEVVFADSLYFAGARDIENWAIYFVPDNQSLGLLTFSIGVGEQKRESFALVSFSQWWILENFDATLSLLRYFGEDAWIDSLRSTPEENRYVVWQEFWVATDPNLATPENEAIEQYFARVQYANKVFNDEDIIDGWLTDRGEVFITLGYPDEIFDRRARAEGLYISWYYRFADTWLYFYDHSQFGRYIMTSDSRRLYEKMLLRARRQAD